MDFGLRICKPQSPIDNPKSEMTVQIPFTKMVGTGNDFVVIDTIHNRLAPLAGDWVRVSRLLCDRHRGAGADGVLVLEPSHVAHVTMRVFNPDGSEVEMCGNGARCIARLVHGWPECRNGPVVVETRAGLVSATVHDDGVQMRMPDPTDMRFDFELEAEGRRFRAAFLTVGVPHLVVPVEDLDEIDVNRFGRALRSHRTFLPRGMNVNFTQADSEDTEGIRLRTYERGVEAETLACGTGATASAIVFGLIQPNLQIPKIFPSPTQEPHACRVQVKVRGGDRLGVAFTVTMHGNYGRVSNVMLKGAAGLVFEGTFPWEPQEGG